MKISISLGVISLAISVAAGCAHPARAPKFDQAYLPNGVPGSPQKRIDLPMHVTDKVRSARGSRSYLPASLYWMEQDRLLLNVHGGKYSDTLLDSVLIVPSTNEVRLLEADERRALASTMEKSSNVVSADTWVDGIANVGKAVIGLAIGIATRGSGGGGSSKDHYAGTIENNGTVLSFDIAAESRKHWGGPFASRYFHCDYSVKNGLTGETVKANRVIDQGDVQYKLKHKTVIYELKDWLKSWRVSPDGRHYLIGKSATLVDPKTGTLTTLIENYRDEYAGFDVSPQWDKIALLKTWQDEKTGQTKYWIEFYRFEIR